MLSETLFNANVIRNSRLTWIDFAKGAAIIMVVFRHIVIGIERSGIPIHEVHRIIADITYSFRMPLFFILSGFFIRKSLQKRSTNEFVMTKVKTLLYPYIIWTFIQISVQIIFSNYINADRTWRDYIAVFINPRAIDQFWYIYALFNLAIVYLILFQLTKGNKIQLFIIGIVFYYINRFIHISVVDDLLENFIYVVIGDLLSGFILNPANQKTIKSYAWLGVFVILFIITQYMYLNYIDLEPFLYAVIALVGSILTIQVSFHLANSNALFFIRVAGFHSLYIYLMHVLVSAPIRIVLSKVFHIENGGLIAIISTIFGCIIPIIFYNLCKRYGMLFLFYPTFGTRKDIKQQVDAT